MLLINNDFFYIVHIVRWFVYLKTLFVNIICKHYKFYNIQFHKYNICAMNVYMNIHLIYYIILYYIMFNLYLKYLA